MALLLSLMRREYVELQQVCRSAAFAPQVDGAPTLARFARLVRVACACTQAPLSPATLSLLSHFVVCNIDTLQCEKAVATWARSKLHQSEPLDLHDLGSRKQVGPDPEGLCSAIGGASDPHPHQPQSQHRAASAVTMSAKLKEMQVGTPRTHRHERLPNFAC